MWVIGIVFDLFLEVLMGLHTGVARAADPDARNDRRGKPKKPTSADRYVHRSRRSM